MWLPVIPKKAMLRSACLEQPSKNQIVGPSGQIDLKANLVAF